MGANELDHKPIGGHKFSVLFVLLFFRISPAKPNLGWTKDPVHFSATATIPQSVAILAVPHFCEPMLLVDDEFARVFVSRLPLADESIAHLS